MKLPIIFVRYAPGACGTFLITMLSSAAETACWNPTIESLKQSNNFSKYFAEWFKEKFTQDLENHLKHEPHHPYKINFFSAKHQRGDNIDLKDFFSLIKSNQDHLLLQNVQKNKYTLLRLNKSTIPKFGYSNPVINILVDNKSVKWLNRTRAIKLFGVEHHSFIFKEEHPDFLKAKNYNLNFRNQYQIRQSQFTFYKKYVINDPVVNMHKHQHLITEHPSNLQNDQHWINLSDLLDPLQAVDKICQLADQLNLTVNRHLLSECYEHYYWTNIHPMLTRNYHANMCVTR
jgi:hypothetical protein